MSGRWRLAHLAAFALIGLLLIEPMWLLRDFGSDDATYWSNAATLALDLDYDFSNETVVVWSADRRIAGGSPGAGWLAAPFVAALSLVDRAQGHPVLDDHSQYHYSWSFYGLFVAALVYFLLGVWLYRKALRAVWPDLDPRLNLLLAFSTGVPFYVLRRFSMAHAYEFAACALGVWAAVELYRALGEGKDTRRWLAWSALAVGLNVAIRVNNLNTLFLGHVVVLLLWVFEVRALPRPDWPRLRRSLLALTGAAVVGMIPFALFSLEFYGSPYPSPAAMYGQPLHDTAARTPFEILAYGLTLVPHLIPLIFSSEWGILYTNPVLVVGGVFLLVALSRRLWGRRDPAHALALLGVLAYLGLSTAIVLWWRSTGTSYGYRYLLPLYPVTLLGVLLAARGRGAERSRIRRAVMPVTVALALVSVISMAMFSASETLETRPGRNVFDRPHSATARGYMTTLPREMLVPRTWVSLPARRLIGFFAAPYMVKTPALRARLPQSWIDTYEILYEPAPIDVTVQLVLLLFGWTAGAWWVVRPAASRAAVGAAAQRRVRPAAAESARAFVANAG